MYRCLLDLEFYKKYVKMSKKLYCVLKLSTEIEYTNPLTNELVTCKLGGFAGYIPVFETIDEAGKSSEYGKYKIIELITE